jgi:hypothetical protein
MRIVGIDPGNAGAIAVIDDKKPLPLITLFDMPILITEGKGKTKKGNVKKHTVLDEQALCSIFKNLMPIKMMFIEKSQSMPGQNAAATFNYAAGYGIIRGVCVGLGIPYTLVHPATWRRSLMKDMDKGKDASIVRAKQLYPTADIGKKDGRAEALLIGTYGKKELFI